MYYSYAHDILFLSQPRTASHAVAKVLMEEYGFFPSNDHHGQLSEAKRFYPISERSIVFSTVRNHFDWFVSFIYDARLVRAGEPISLEKLERFYKENAKWFSPPNCVFGLYLPDCTHIIKYENLKEDLNSILQLRGLEVVNEIPKVNASKHERVNYRKVLDQLCINWIVNQFGHEMRDLGHWPNLRSSL